MANRLAVGLILLIVIVIIFAGAYFLGVGRVDSLQKLFGSEPTATATR